MKTNRFLHTFVVFTAHALLGCGVNDVTNIGEPEPQASASAERPLYALLSIVFDADDNASSYIVLSDTVNLAEVSLETAREFPGRVNIGVSDGDLFVASDVDLSVTRYSISDNREWSRGDRVSFQNQGLDGWQVQLQSLVDDDAAYMPFDITGRLLWSPSRLEIVGSRTESRARASKNGLEGYCSGWGFEQKQGALFFACSYNDPVDYHNRGADVDVVIYDAASHEETDFFSIDCPGIGYTSQDEAGNSYLANWDYWPTRALYGLARPACVRRLLPDGKLDASWAPDLTQWTGGRHIMAWQYLRDGMAIGNVLYHEQLGTDFSGPIDPDVQLEIENGEHYRPWLFDLTAQTARPIEGFDDLLWALPLATIDERQFAMLPYDNYGRTEIYEIDLDGTATRRLGVSGYVESWVRLR